MKKLLFISILTFLGNNLELKASRGYMTIVTGTCSMSAECASNKCLYGNCVAPTNAANGTACNANSQCHSNICKARTGRCNGGLADGANCKLSDDCASVQCVNSKCQRSGAAGAGGGPSATSAS